VRKSNIPKEYFQKEQKKSVSKNDIPKEYFQKEQAYLNDKFP